MTTIICSTNRHGARSRIVFNKIVELYKSKNPEESPETIDLKDLNFSLHGDQYVAENQSPALTKVQDEVLIPSDKFIFVVPEYNGSFAGITKYFIDALSIRKYKETFKGKKVLLIGVAKGRAGNLRGLDQLTTLFSYLGTSVYPKRLPISRIESLLENDQLTDEYTIQTLDELIDEFILF